MAERWRDTARPWMAHGDCAARSFGAAWRCGAAVRLLSHAGPQCDPGPLGAARLAMGGEIRVGSASGCPAQPAESCLAQIK